MSDSGSLRAASLPYILRIIAARPRLVVAVLLGALVGFTLPSEVVSRSVTRVVLGWSAGVGSYLILVMFMIFGSAHKKIHARARLEDEGQIFILVLMIFSVLFSIFSIVGELGVVRHLEGMTRYLHLALAAMSIATSWLFTHVMFALHYAHDFYRDQLRGGNGGLLFPGNEEPDYFDFLYFSFILGTSAQTADVSFLSKRMRRLGLVHCVFSFFFNTTLLALAINMASGLL